MDNKKPDTKSKISNYFRTISSNSAGNMKTVATYTLVSAIANALLISILNAAADSAQDQEISLKFLAMFIVTMVLFYVSKRFILRHATRLTEKSIYRIRLDVVEAVQKAELRVLEHIGKSRIFTRVTHDTNFISQTSAVIINAGQSAILVFFTLLYIAYLSLTAFVITVSAISLASFVFLSRQKQINEEIRRASEKETELFTSLNHILNGFKELKMNQKKNDDISEHFEVIAKEGRDLKTATGLRFAVGYMFSATVFYLLIGTIVFVVPQYTLTYPSTITKLTAAILFIIGPLENIVSTIPIFFKAHIAIENINQLKKQIEEQITNRSFEPNPELFRDFKSIKLVNFSFRYQDRDGETVFVVGPLDFELKRNQVYLLKGGNGSGKSSMLKLLTGLYKGESGHIEIDGMRLQDKDFQSFRELFTIIFTDFHLFDRLYGLEGVEPERVRSLIKKFGLAHKTDFQDGRFTNIDLSTGQKKRLGLIVSILEDKAIYIYDEVAADQDPEFKAYFYQQFLTELKQQGKTIVFVSHDDQYFSNADEVIQMENGQIV